jgi:diguanylate cyclase (GGDEF)-like protein/PAS domain S-box-containing protein
MQSGNKNVAFSQSVRVARPDAGKRASIGCEGTIMKNDDNIGAPATLAQAEPPAGVFVLDAQHRLLGLSAGLREQLGADGGLLAAALHADVDAAGAGATGLADALAASKTLRLALVPIQSPQGAASGYVGVLGRPGSAGTRFQELLDHLPAGVVVHGPDGVILTANRAAERLLGRTLDKLRGVEASETEWTLLQADGKPMSAELYPVHQVLRTGVAVAGFIAGLRREGGGVSWMICNAYPVQGPAGALVEVVVCFTDCTNLKDAEQQLRKSEERLRLVLRGSRDAVWDFDLRSGEAYYSDRWWEMLGYQAGEVSADQQTWRRFLHPDDRLAMNVFMQELLGGTRDSFSIELRLAHRDGHYVPVLTRGFVLHDGAGRPVRVSGTNTDLTERKESEQRIYHLAYFDHLTGLPNRRHLLEQLAKIGSRSSRQARIGALLFIDLDNFKQLNDTLGHEAGDLLLQQVAERLRHSVRDSDQLARMGGDEFVVALENLGATDEEAAVEAEKVAHKMLAVLQRPHRLAVRAVTITPSIGISLFGNVATAMDEVLKQADIAMYHAKAAGRNTLRFFDPAMQAAIDARSLLENDLRQGLHAGAFPLHCQPQFSADGRLVGGEMLLRWQHPRRGLVGPGEFIDLAESTGLIVAIGQQALNDACACLARWANLPVLCDISLAVNVSVQQLVQPDFVERVLAILEQTGAPPIRLCLELTESILAEDDVIDKMLALRRHGVLFSLDDFGTGYSSLSYLKRFPFCALKVDRSFVNDARTGSNAGAIAELIVALGKTLGLKVIAEGVENEQQFGFLREQRCDAFQGFLFAPALPLDEFERRYGATPA